MKRFLIAIFISIIDRIKIQSIFKYAFSTTNKEKVINQGDNNQFTETIDSTGNILVNVLKNSD